MTGVPAEVWLLALVSFLAGCGFGGCLTCVFAWLGVKAFADEVEREAGQARAEGPGSEGRPPRPA